MTSDYMDQCNPELKIPIANFERDICSQCANPKCRRSRYTDSATQEKISRHERLMLVDINEIPQSPLSEYPEAFVHRVEVKEHELTSPEPESPPGDHIHRVELPEEETHSIDEVTAVLRSTMDYQEAVTAPSDPWEVPALSTVGMYKEYDDPTQDPWSVDYQGPIEKRASPGESISVPGGKK